MTTTATTNTTTTKAGPLPADHLPTPAELPNAPVVIYDGHCKFCTGQVKNVRRWDGRDRVAFISLHDPEVARRWLDSGAGWLHVVSLDGAFGERDSANRQALQSILQVSREFDAQIQFGGGMRSLDAIEDSLKLGIHRVILGTIAVEQPEIVKEAIQRFGAERIAAGIDARDGLHDLGEDVGF